MFACSLDTKSHESVVSLNSKAFVIHTALLAIGSEPGSPAKFRPTYEPARGPVIKVEVEWIDGQGKLRRTPAQSWVRDLRTKKPMTYDWVFGGSSIWEDPASKKRFYRAEGGEVICVSNFPTAMMDLPIKSSESNDQLAFEALTESIPPRDTPVRVYLYEAKDNPDAAKEPESPK